MRKSGRLRDIPPPLELECLKALWELGEAKVKDVRHAMTRHRELAYTTVMTILERLARKGHVSRRKVGRSFAYESRLSREHLRRLAVRELVDSFFDGSEERLAAYLQNGYGREADFRPDSERAEPAPLDTALL